MIEHLKSPQAARTWCERVRGTGGSIGFVATMGALHPGHISLVDRARTENETVVASIFVNPLQFNNSEDLEKYPRTEADDIQQLEAAGVDMVFTGMPQDFLGDAFSKSADQLPDPGIYAKSMEGAHRPGHFAGVQEVVSRLLSFVGPCRAYFGEKDYQQLQIIQQLANSMTGIEVVPCPTSRENSGLARSSRNLRLSDRGRREATVIYRAMQAANSAWLRGTRSPAELQVAMLEVLDNSEEFDSEYAEVRDPLNWTVHQPEHEVSQARVFIAGIIENVRLIDNMALGDQAAKQ